MGCKSRIRLASSCHAGPGFNRGGGGRGRLAFVPNLLFSPLYTFFSDKGAFLTCYSAQGGTLSAAPPKSQAEWLLDEIGRLRRENNRLHQRLAAKRAPKREQTHFPGLL